MLCRRRRKSGGSYCKKARKSLLYRGRKGVLLLKGALMQRGKDVSVIEKEERECRYML